MDKKICKNCRFFVVWTDERYGQCYFEPPTVNSETYQQYKTEPTHHGPDKKIPDGIASRTIAERPRVFDKEFCGRFEGGVEDAN